MRSFSYLFILTLTVSTSGLHDTSMSIGSKGKLMRSQRLGGDPAGDASAGDAPADDAPAGAGHETVAGMIVSGKGISEGQITVKATVPAGMEKLECVAEYEILDGVCEESCSNPGDSLTVRAGFAPGGCAEYGFTAFVADLTSTIWSKDKSEGVPATVSFQPGCISHIKIMHNHCEMFCIQETDPKHMKYATLSGMSNGTCADYDYNVYVGRTMFESFVKPALDAEVKEDERAEAEKIRARAAAKGDAMKAETASAHGTGEASSSGKHGDGGHGDGGHSDKAHDDAGHGDKAKDDGGHGDKGHDDGGHGDKGHDDGGHGDKGHDDGGHGDKGHSDGGHKDGGHDDAGHGHGGHGSGGHGHH